MCNQAAAGLFVEGVEDAFEEVVGFFQLIIKQSVALGKLKGFEVAFFHQGKAQAVECCEHPAAAALFLIGDLALGQADGVIVCNLAVNRIVSGAGINSVCIYSVHRNGMYRILVKFLLKTAECFWGNGGIHIQSLL